MKRTRTQGGFPKKKKWSPPSNKARMYKQIRSAVGVESKYWDSPIGFNLPAATDWAATNAISMDMPSIAAGDDVYQRNGKKVVLSKITFRGRLTMTPTTGQTIVQGAVGCRIVLISNCKTTQTLNNTTTSGTEVFGAYSTTATPANIQVGVATFLNPAYFGKYKVLKDKMINIQPAAATNNAGATTVSQTWNEVWVKMTYKIPGGGQVLDFVDTTGVSPVNMGYNILANSDTTTGTPSLQGVIRFYFTDA